jgi:beta-xylosidase
MEDYHVFSSENLTDWTDHGVLINQTNVPWLTRKSFDMWAPDCVFKNGKYYFYFPTGGHIGVAIADKPYGPFKPEEKPIQGANGIDPGLLMDKDGSAYMFWARGRISVAKLKDNMVELDSPAQVVANLPTSGLIEGPFAFERNGIYYLTYPHVQTTIERLEYATSTNPMGPYKQAGVLLDEAASGCWTVHQSVVEYKGQWYLFYHDKDLSPDFDKNRSIRADYLYFNEDGSIKKVIPTLRGVGMVDAKSKVQIDRYSDISKEGVSVSFLNETNKFEGWKISLNGKNTWVRFDRVDFGKGDLKSVNARSISATGGTVEIHLDKTDGPLVARIEIGKASDWKVVNSKLANVPAGIHNLVVTQSDDNKVDLDWISFE